VSLTRAAHQEFSALSDASIHGFTLTGSGTATVVTPAAYGHRSSATVRVLSPSGTQTERMRVRRGRLRIVVPLGTTRTIRVAIS
jgi:hypothetical protein